MKARHPGEIRSRTVRPGTKGASLSDAESDGNVPVVSEEPREAMESPRTEEQAAADAQRGSGDRRWISRALRYEGDQLYDAVGSFAKNVKILLQMAIGVGGVISVAGVFIVKVCSVGSRASATRSINFSAASELRWQLLPWLS